MLISARLLSIPGRSGPFGSHVRTNVVGAKNKDIDSVRKKIDVLETMLKRQNVTSETASGQLGLGGLPVVQEALQLQSVRETEHVKRRTDVWETAAKLRLVQHYVKKVNEGRGRGKTYMFKSDF